MKKLLSALILLAMVFTLAACEDNGGKKDKSSKKPEATAKVESVDTEETEEATETEAPEAEKTEESSEIETDESELTVDYGSSEVFSKEDMDEAIAVINGKFEEWRGCKVHSIRYGGDDKNIEDNVEWANDCIDGQSFTEVMEFETDFHSPTEVSGEWGDSDTEYDDYQWWFARTDGGKWQLFYWSY